MTNSREIREAIMQLAEQIASAAEESAPIYADHTGEEALLNFARVIRATNAITNQFQTYQ